MMQQRHRVYKGRAGGKMGRKKVRCKETGKVFESINEAAIALGVAATTVSMYANGRIKFPEKDINIEWVTENE